MSCPNISLVYYIAKLKFFSKIFHIIRYPIHWHLMGNVEGMYVRGCAIHNTFNRAIAIHGKCILILNVYNQVNIKAKRICLKNTLHQLNFVTKKWYQKV